MSSSPKMMCISQDPVPSPECVTPAAHPRHLRRRAEWTERPTGTWGYPDYRHFYPEKILGKYGKMMINHWSQIQNNPIFSQPTELKWNLQYPTWTIPLLYCTCLGTSHRYELRWFRSELKDMRPSMFALWVHFCVCVLGP